MFTTAPFHNRIKLNTDLNMAKCNVFNTHKTSTKMYSNIQNLGVTAFFFGPNCDVWIVINYNLVIKAVRLTCNLLVVK